MVYTLWRSETGLEFYAHGKLMRRHEIHDLVDLPAAWVSQGNEYHLYFPQNPESKVVFAARSADRRRAPQ
ncbi:MAG: hypothetical protein K2W96_13865, partial [Gemmataceae bacterium]|nr:hypothetical protein [Gemmataceae bacterium]